MRRTSLFTLAAFSVLFGFASLHCLGEDATAPTDQDGGGAADGASADGSSGGAGGDADAPPSDGGAGDSGDAAVLPPHIPVTDSYLKSPSPHIQALFGGAVALSADGNTLAIGSQGEDSAATGINNTNPGPGDRTADFAGAVFVFTRSAAGVWSQQAYIKASNTVAGQNFGKSVSLSSDGNRLAVGATGEGTSAVGSGAVYIYNRVGTSWVIMGSGPFKPSNPMQSGAYGYSVSLSGDGNSLAVGAFGESATDTGISTGVGGTFTGASVFHGAVYLLAYVNGSWKQTHYVKPSVFKAGARFGSSVALNGAGSVLLVGAQGESSAAKGVSTSAATDTGADGSGAAYVFENNAGTWSQSAFVKASNTRAGARFGTSAAMAANGSTFVVGSNFETSGATGVNNTDPGPDDTTATNSGAAYVFAKNASGVFAQTAYLKASNTKSNTYFAQAVAMSIDGKTVVCGSTPEASAATGVNNANPGQMDTTLPNAGAAYVFGLVGGAWQQTAYLKQFRPVPRAVTFGIAVATTNGAGTVAVGAQADPSTDVGVNGTNNDTGASGAGAVFTFK